VVTRKRALEAETAPADGLGSPPIDKPEAADGEADAERVLRLSELATAPSEIAPSARWGAPVHDERLLQDEAVGAFLERYPDVGFAPILVVIPAYNEASCIGTVLPAVPREIAGLSMDTLLVDDGSSDDTSDVARSHGVYVARLSQNSGQGSALRLGYRLAREHGAQFIVTLDADGQWDPAEIERLVEPLVRNEADLVLGSRILGRAETDDSVRRAGVHVFARFLRLVTRQPITDTSTGIRAMKADLTAQVPQKEPQYQASELLIGAIYRGYRITERPVVMRKRVAGKSKKGHNLMYGLRYGRVVMRTWWRESRAARARNNSGAR
jgi:glycosyltransferase involved in cell wall biosynthesis